MLEARDLAHEALVTLEALDNLLIEIDQGEDEDEQAKRIQNEVKKAFDAVEDMKASIDAWKLNIGELLPEQSDDEGISVAAE